MAGTLALPNTCHSVLLLLLVVVMVLLLSVVLVAGEHQGCAAAELLPAAWQRRGAAV